MEYNKKNGLMTLDEAIEHALFKVKEMGCTGCAAEHSQLAVWLIELRDYKRKDRLLTKFIFFF